MTYLLKLLCSSYAAVWNYGIDWPNCRLCASSWVSGDNGGRIIHEGGTENHWRMVITAHWLYPCVEHLERLCGIVYSSVWAMLMSHVASIKVVLRFHLWYEGVMDDTWTLNLPRTPEYAWWHWWNFQTKRRWKISQENTLEAWLPFKVW